jgi:hypothetical protein
VRQALRQYLALEAEMLRLDAGGGGEQDADELRDLMDDVWKRLTSNEKAELNQRAFVPDFSRPKTTLVMESSFFILRTPFEPRRPQEATTLTVTPREFWWTA